MSNIFFNSSPVIFNIASQLNPGELNNDKYQARKILSTCQ